MVVKRRFEEPKVGPRPDSIYGDDWLGDIYQVVVGGRQDVGWQGWLDFPVGMGAPSVFIQRDRVPAVVPATATPPPPPLPPSPPPGEEPFVKEVVQEVTTVSWSDWMAAGNALPPNHGNYPHASDYPGLGAGVGGVGLVESGESEVSILGDIYDVIDTGLGGILPGGVPFAGFGGPTSPAAQIYSGAGTMQQMIAAPGGGGGTTVIPGTGGPVGGACGPTMIYNSRTGKWTQKRRRRRRQLATASDIKDLNSLIAVFGNGKALQSWIATHS